VPDIWALMRAIRCSTLSAPERHTLLTLASLVDANTGLIPERFQPSLTDLTRFTGLGRSTVVRALNAAETAGWIKRTVPTKKAAQMRKDKTSYLLAIPDGVLAGDDDEPDGASATAGLVPERDQFEGWSHSGTSATAGLGLVPQRDGASATAGHEVLNHVHLDKPPPPSEEGPHCEVDDVAALFSVPGQREPSAQSTRATEAKRQAPAKRKRLSRDVTKNPETLPADWAVSAEMAAWAKDKASDVIQRIATERFLVYFGEGGKRKKDWDLAWRNWLLGDQQRFEERASGPANNGVGYTGRGAGTYNQQRSTYHHLRDSRAPGRDYKERL
jgi:hypothetical protein